MMEDATPILPTSADIGGALAAHGEATFLWRLSDDRISWSPDAATCLGLTPSRVPRSGAAWREQMFDADCGGRDAWIAEGAHDSFGAETRITGPGGAEQWIEERLRRIDDPAHGALITGFARDITDRKRREERLSYLAGYDQMTGHLNRLMLRGALARAIAQALRDGPPVSFAILALDNLTGMNEAYGYDVADELIVQVGVRLGHLLTPGETLGRMTGAKYGVILLGRDADAVAVFMEAARDCVRETVVDTHAGPVAVTISAGAALLPEHGRTTHDGMANAEEALQTSRMRHGPDNAILYEYCEERIATRRHNMCIAEEIVAALSESRLTLAYQPVVSSADGRSIAFHECLLRMRARDGRVVPAGEFMPVAEKLGLVRMLDRRVLEMAFETLRAAPRVRLSINLSPQSARDMGWMRSFVKLADGNRDVAERLIVEITEATAIDDAQQTGRIIDQLHALGCAFAVDDFGAGYTSFRHFKELKMDMVKIDGDFIKGVCDSPDNQLFVRTLVEIAKNFDMMTVAEMVGDDREAELLRGMGIDAFQGFHFGKPKIDPNWLRAAMVEGSGVVAI